MDKHFNNIKARNTQELIVGVNTEDFTLENTRTDSDRLKRSANNPSVRLYMFVVVLNTIALILYLSEII